MIEDLRKKAAELLEGGEVKVVIGYGQGSNPRKIRPVFITKPDDVENLVWNEYCVNNLTVYLTKDDVKALGKPAVVVKGCDAKAIVALVQESQFNREDVIALGVACDGVEDPIAEKKCVGCDVHNPQNCDFVFGESTKAESNDSDGRYAEVDELDGKSDEEKWEFWKKEFEKCIRCYACRQACPLCYCTQCIAYKNKPQWVETSPHLRGNLHWNIVRAFHLAGRCIECGECERVCPMDIPLMLVNKKLAKVVEEKFDYKSGYESDVPIPVTTYTPDDPEDFVR